MLHRYPVHLQVKFVGLCVIIITIFSHTQFAHQVFGAVAGDFVRVLVIEFLLLSFKKKPKKLVILVLLLLSFATLFSKTQKDFPFAFRLDN